MSNWESTCCYTEGVECDKEYSTHCDKCGFKPAVHRARAAKVREKIRRQEITLTKKYRGVFVYPDRFY